MVPGAIVGGLLAYLVISNATPPPPYQPPPPKSAEQNGPIVIKEVLRAVTEADIPRIVADGHTEKEARAWLGLPLVTSTSVEYRMVCPALVIERGWERSGRIRPAQVVAIGAKRISDDPSYTLNITETMLGPQDPAMFILVNARLRVPSMYVVDASAGSNMPCTDPRTGRKWWGSVGVIKLFVDGVEP